MLISVYIILQITAIALLFVTLNDNKPLYSAMTAVVSGILMVGAWIINTGMVYVWDAAQRVYQAEPNIIHTPYLAYFNMAIFGLAIAYFFLDTFTNSKSLIPDKDPNTGNNKGGKM